MPLVDKAIIDNLYAASQAGVKIDLIVRGICCLVPGMPGLSENIRVRSLVGRFLEHARAYYFENAGGKPAILAGSADWMSRNFFRRVEAVFPVADPGLAEVDHRRTLPRRIARQRERPGPPKQWLLSSRSAPPRRERAFSAQDYYIEDARKRSAPAARRKESLGIVLVAPDQIPHVVSVRNRLKGDFRLVAGRGRGIRGPRLRKGRSGRPSLTR